MSELSGSLLVAGSVVLEGRFRIERLLGRGGMGDVYLAEQVSLERKVALKVLRPELFMQPGMSERFRREAKLLSAIEHPSIVRVIDFGEAGSSAFLVMEYVDGRTLEQALSDEPFDVARSLRILLQITEGLAAIHQRGIVHRDLKADNVILSRDSFAGGERARLLDFGIAKLAEPSSAEGAAMTQAGIVLGTPEYISPEQAVGSPADARSDVYAFGVLAFRALAGRLPFAGSTPQRLLAQHLTAEVPALLDVAPGLASHPELVALVTQCLAKEPNARPADGRTLARVLTVLIERSTTTDEGEGYVRHGEAGATSASTTAASEAAPRSATTAFGAQSPGPSPAQGTIVPAGTLQLGAIAAQVQSSAADATSTASFPSCVSTAPSHAQLPSGEGVAPHGERQAVAHTTSHLQSAPTDPAPSVRSPRTTGDFYKAASLTSAQEGLRRPENLTLMLTDIKGFTARTSRQTREENARMLEEHDALLLPVIRRYGGRLIQKRGDALFVTFTSPTEAVKCGMAIQNRLWEQNREVEIAWQLHVRVCVHLGEVFVTRDGVIGEPTQVVAQVEGEADAGEVVFTEAVRLSMTQSEIDFEPRGQLRLEGSGDTLKLYRCTPKREGSPFAALEQPSPIGNTAHLVEQLRGHASRRLTVARLGAQRALLRARALPRSTLRLLAAGVAVAIILAVVGAVYRQQPLPRASRLLSEGKPGDALRIVQSLPETDRESLETRALEATALHALSRHREEHAALAALSPESLDALDAEAFAALASDFGRNERDVALKALLAKLPEETLRSRFTSLATDDEGAAQWGALRYLDISQRTGALELGPLYLASLESTECAVRGVAARRLGELKDQTAVEALETLRKQPKKKSGLFSENNCGQDEAAAALRAIRKQ